MVCTNIKKHMSGFQLFRQPGSHMGLSLKESLCGYTKPGSWMDPDRLPMDVLGEGWKSV